jgi:hypothetical protein
MRVNAMKAEGLPVNATTRTTRSCLPRSRRAHSAVCGAAIDADADADEDARTHVQLHHHARRASAQWFTGVSTPTWGMKLA